MSIPGNASAQVGAFGVSGRDRQVIWVSGRRADLVTYEYRRDRREFLRHFTHCFWCGGVLRFDLVRHRLSPTVDHRIEVVAGADPRDRSNWVPAHLGCNSARSANVTRRRLVRSEEW